MLQFIFILILIASKSCFSLVDQDGLGFKFEGFLGANISTDGMAAITANGLLRLTNTTSQNQVGHAFFSLPLPFLSGNGSNSFSTMFAIALVPDIPNLSGNGIAFFVSPTDNLVGAQPSGFLGLMNDTTNGDPSNHIFAVEMDTIENTEFADVNDNHVGIDVNSLTSNSSAPPAYYSDEEGRFVNMTLATGEPLLLWVDYDGGQKQLNVTIAPINIPKPSRPLLSSNLDLSTIFLDEMFVGFSSATKAILTTHYILGWSFAMNRPATPLNLQLLPQLPKPSEKSKLLTIGLPIILSVVVLGALICIAVILVKKMKYAEVIEEWEIDYGPQRFSYKDLHKGSGGFNEKNLLGQGGFGKVYRAVMPNTNVEVAVKKISHNSGQGMREFIAEIASIGRIRHPALVRLQGYCRRKTELLLVYDYMINGSLDNYLYDSTNSLTLNWNQRLKILRQVASGLLFLHEEWNEVVLHRDIKPSNVLLDEGFNGKLGDFGLARLYQRGSNPQTTQLVGTIGYIAPELNRTGKMSLATDVYAFGIFMLEVACGRRSLEPKEALDWVFLAEWVMHCLTNGNITDAADGRLRGDYVTTEMELVLKLGLVCSQNAASDRPSMGQVVQYLNEESPLPEMYIDSNQVSGRRNVRRGQEEKDGGLSSSSASFDTISLLFTR